MHGVSAGVSAPAANMARCEASNVTTLNARDATTTTGKPASGGVHLNDAVPSL